MGFEDFEKIEKTPDWAGTENVSKLIAAVETEFIDLK